MIFKFLHELVTT